MTLTPRPFRTARVTALLFGGGVLLGACAQPGQLGQPLPAAPAAPAAAPVAVPAPVPATVERLRAGGVHLRELEIPPGPCAVFTTPAGRRLGVYELVRPTVAEHFAGRFDP